MGLLEPITHKNEIDEILSEAEAMQENSINRFNYDPNRWSWIYHRFNLYCYTL